MLFTQLEMNFLLTFLFLLIQKAACEQGQCSLDTVDTNCGDDESKKWRNLEKEETEDEENDLGLSSASSTLTNLIFEAHKNYKPCNIDYDQVNNQDINQECKTCFDSQIDSDLKIWTKNGISKEIISRSSDLGIKYQIINHKLYREPSCNFPARCAGIEHFLLKIKNQLPNLEFVVNVRDWPQVRIDSQQSTKSNVISPVFSFSKPKDEFADILFPAWSFWSGGPAIDKYPRGIGDWDRTRESIKKAAQGIKWDQKLNTTFFRGSRTSSHRDVIILFSRSFPELLDAKYTKNQAWKSDLDTLGDVPAPTVTFEEHCVYKYLLNVRGVAASFRLKHLFMCDSIVLDVSSSWIEFFQPQLKPWIHFIPVDSDFKNFYKVIEFLKQNDNYGRKVSKNGHEFILNNLRNQDVLCYWKNLLLKYSQLLNYEPQLDSGLVEILK